MEISLHGYKKKLIKILDIPKPFVFSTKIMKEDENIETAATEKARSPRTQGATLNQF